MYIYFRGGYGSDVGSSIADSLGRHDSLDHPVDDDEDRIPEELLLKYVVIVHAHHIFIKCCYISKKCS
jgi:hypothetical protein